MKKYIVLLTIVVYMLSGCHREGSWEFQYEPASVKEIKLVEVDGEHGLSVVKEIDISYANELFLDISKIDWKVYGPNLATPRGICFMIVFDNGDYDIISYYEPKHCSFDEDGVLHEYNSWLCCDNEVFQTILDKYQ